MQNIIVRMARAIAFVLVFIWLGVVSALAEDDLLDSLVEVCWELSTEIKKLGSEEIREEIRLGVEKVLEGELDINERSHNGNGTTFFHFTSACYSIEFVSALLQAGAKVDVRDAIFGYTPLHMAAGVNPDSEVITALIVAGSDIHARLKDGRTPLHLAAKYNKNPEVIMLLLKAGSIGGLVDREGKTPFDYAEKNEAIKGTDAYWALNDARY